MKRFVFALGVLVVLVLLSGITLVGPLVPNSDFNKIFKQNTVKAGELMAGKRQYHGLCTKCNYNWVSTTAPRKCPRCGSGQITYNQTSIIDCKGEYLYSAIIFPSESARCINEGYACTLNGTPCCSPYKCKGKFPNTTCR